MCDHSGNTPTLQIAYNSSNITVDCLQQWVIIVVIPDVIYIYNIIPLSHFIIIYTHPLIYILIGC